MMKKPMLYTKLQMFKIEILNGSSYLLFDQTSMG